MNVNEIRACFQHPNPRRPSCPPVTGCSEPQLTGLLALRIQSLKYLKMSLKGWILLRWCQQMAPSEYSKPVPLIHWGLFLFSSNASKIQHNSASPVRSPLSVCSVWVRVCVHKPVNYLFLCASVVCVWYVGPRVCTQVCELPFPECISCLRV